MEFDVRSTAIGLAIAGVLAAAGAYFTGLNGFVLFGIAVAAMLVVGVLAAFEKGPSDE